MYSAEQLENLLARAFPEAVVAVQDATGTGNHFQATVVSEEFAGKSLVQQHQMVYAALRPVMEGDLHALGLKTSTPDAWERLRG